MISCPNHNVVWIYKVLNTTSSAIIVIIYQTNICNTLKITKYQFNGLLMKFTKIFHKPVDHINDMWNVWMSIDYNIIYNAYGTLDMCSFSISIFYDKVEDNLKWNASRVLFDLQSWISNAQVSSQDIFFVTSI